MWMVTSTWIIAGIAIIQVMASDTSQEDSLRSALNAVNRRRRDLLPNYKDYYYKSASNYYGPNDRNSLAFLNTNRDKIGELYLFLLIDDDDNHDHFAQVKLTSGSKRYAFTADTDKNFKPSASTTK